MRHGAPEAPWWVPVHHGVPSWCTMAGNGASLCTMVHYATSWCTKEHHGAPWCTNAGAPAPVLDGALQVSTLYIMSCVSYTVLCTLHCGGGVAFAAVDPIHSTPPIIVYNVTTSKNPKVSLCFSNPLSSSLFFSYYIFADGPVLGYVCLCCVTFLLMEPF